MRIGRPAQRLSLAIHAAACTALVSMTVTGAELITNGDFSLGSGDKPTIWTTHDTLSAYSIRDTSVYRSAPASGRMVGLPRTTRVMFWQDFSDRLTVPPAVPNDTLVVVFYTKGVRAHRAFQVTIEGGDWQTHEHSYREYPSVPVDTLWKRISLTFLDTLPNNYLRIHFDTRDSAVVWVDDVSIVRAGEASASSRALTVTRASGVPLCATAKACDLLGRIRTGDMMGIVIRAGAGVASYR